MTLAAALTDYTAAYKAHAIAKGRTFNIDVAAQYSTMDLLNMVKGIKEEHALQIIQEEIEIYRREA